MYRTHNCGQLRLYNKNEKVILSGWVHKIRKLKLKTFIDIRDFYGITQLIILNKKIKKKIKKEYLIKIKGKVLKREKKNKKILTGEIEILVKKIKILNKSKKLPFNIGEKNIKKDLKFKYRYLDFRQNEIKKNLIKKNKIINLIRFFLIKKEFLELETPFLVKTSLEGARDFIIPSRNQKGYFYSLPQSPQIFKQLFMIGGFDKYYQIVKCFRDEDTRSDRQPEFTQLDIEMSFVKRKEIFNIIEKLIKFLFYKIKKIKIINFLKISYKNCLKKYKTEKPDLRKKIFFIKIEKKYIKKKYLKIKKKSFILPNFKNIENFNIKKIKKILIENIGKKNFLIFNFKNKKKYFKNFQKFKKKFFFSKYDILLILFCKNKKKIKKIKFILNKYLLNKKYKKNIYIPIWIYNFPLFKYNLNKKKYESFHHPFTKPIIKKKINNKKKFYKLKAYSYDLIINGIEIGSGSLRINKKKLQKKIFNLLKLSRIEIKKNFDFFLNALNFGTPPHGGIGIGLDRLILLFLNEKDIKNIIPFPKNNENKDIMLETPTFINKKKLLELGIKIIKKNDKK